MTMRRWNGVRESLRRDRGPSRSGDVWHRIEASRAAGASVELPADRPRTLPRVGLYAALALASLLVLVPSGTNPPPPVPALPVIDWGWPFLPQEVLAQAAHAPHLPAIGAPDGSRLKPGRWVYAWTQTRQSRAPDSSEMADTVTIRRGTFRNDSVWLVTRRTRRVSGRGPGRFDSLYLDLSNLRLLRHALLVPALDRLRVAGSVDFERDSLRWQFVVPGSGTLGRGRDTVITASLPPDKVVQWWLGLPLALNGIQFAKNWTGAVPMLLLSIDWLGHDSPVHVYWIDLRVTGREQVTVPAGRFDCWRISEKIPGNEDRKATADVWVDTRSGVVVKEGPGATTYPAGGRELVAILP
jgi:hypothetical protein